VEGEYISQNVTKGQKYLRRGWCVPDEEARSYIQTMVEGLDLSDVEVEEEGVEGMPAPIVFETNPIF
jgi:hypothetical protein